MIVSLKVVIEPEPGDPELTDERALAVLRDALCQLRSLRVRETIVAAAMEALARTPPAGPGRARHRNQPAGAASARS